MAAWLNYHHLLYFWTVARLGSITAAAKELSVSSPTISAQLKALEDSFGQPLLVRRGRGLSLTEAGRMVYGYADDIFRLGRELQSAMGGAPVQRSQRLRFTVGIVEVLPKVVAERLLQPAVDAVADLALECREGALPQLLTQLALHEVDVVLSDAPATPDVRVKVFNHALGETGVSFLRAKGASRRGANDFPRLLHRAPVLLPSRASHLRRALDDWFALQEVTPDVVGEFDDSALMTVFGGRGMGIFPAPSAIEPLLLAAVGLEVVGRTTEVTERYWAVSAERRVRHPALAAVVSAARTRLFRA